MTLKIDLTRDQLMALESEAKARSMALPEYAKLRLLECLPASIGGSLTEEELDSERQWDDAFDATTDEQFARLEQKFLEDIRANGVTPLGLSRK